MTNKEILKIAMEQSAIDNSCEANDFLAEENVVVYSKTDDKARVELPHFCNLVSYGNNIVASIDKLIEDDVREYINKYSLAHCFEPPNFYILNATLSKYDMKICFIAEFFLPDVERIAPQKCSYDLKKLDTAELSALDRQEWTNALSSEKERHLDVLGVGAYDGDRLIGLAACSKDCESMWQIGVDVKPEYRNKNVGAAVTSSLAMKIIERGIVPFYCCVWSNIKSVRNALKSGFKPAWVEMIAKKTATIDKLNDAISK